MLKREADALKRENLHFLEIAKCFYALEVTLFSTSNLVATAQYIARIEKAAAHLKVQGYEPRVLVQFWRAL